LDKRRIFALLITATILIAITTPLALLTPTPQQARLAPIRNPIAIAPQTQWNKTYGGTDDDTGHSVQQTGDGGYILAGSRSSGTGSRDFWLLKIDAGGTQQWSKTYGGTEFDVARYVQKTSDGGYILAGDTDSFGAGYEDFWLVKTDSSGNQQWNKTYGGIGSEMAFSAQQTSDGGYIIAGCTTSFGAGGWDFWLVKTSSVGTQQWNKTYGGSNDDAANSVQQTSDGGYIVAGGTKSFGAGEYDFWLVKTSSVGTQQWSKTYGGIHYDAANSVRQTSDGGYIVVGYTGSSGAGAEDFWLVKTDSAGNEQWNKTYGGTGEDYPDSVQQVFDGGYIVAGHTSSFGAGSSDFWLVKTDPSGNHQWNKTYGGHDIDYAHSIQQTGDGGYIVVGSTESFGAGGWDLWVVKTADATPPSTIADLAVSNPETDSLTLTWTAPGDEWNTGTARGYVVKYSTADPINEANWDSATTLPQSWKPKANGTTETFVLSGLSSNTKYWFAIRAYDEASNYGGVSNSPSGTTLIASAAGSSTWLIVVALAVVAIVAILVLVHKKNKKRKRR
jgi:hypothetical protein